VGFANPANLGLLQRSEFRFHWSTEPNRVTGVKDWGVFTGVPHLGFSAQRQEVGALSVTDYRLGLGFGSRASSFGLAYGWSGGDSSGLGRENLLVAGTVMRPASFLSLALTGHFSTGSSSAYEWVGEVGVRPLGTPLLTVFADAAWPKDAALEDVPWSAGASVRVFSGIDITGRYFDSESFTVGLVFNLGGTGVSGQSHFDSNQEYAYQNWGIRVGGLRTGLATSSLNRNRYYVPIETRGTVRYLKYSLFDRGGKRFYEILDDIVTAQSDPRVALIAVNLSGTKMAPEHAWEIREALADAKRAGKTVLVYLDYAGMTGYHLASVADHIVMDTQGMLTLPGYMLNRTYMRGSLEKLGLKFDEWRYFDYKSAAEPLVRDDMSDADREQNQAFVDDWYEQTRSDVMAGRNMSAERFDGLINDQVLFTPDSAKSAGLVDTLARWSDLGALIPRLTSKRLKPLSPNGVLQRAQVDDQWGEQPRVAVVYALSGAGVSQPGSRPARQGGGVSSGLARRRPAGLRSGSGSHEEVQSSQARHRKSGAGGCIRGLLDFHVRRFRAGRPHHRNRVYRCHRWLVV
jgi:protease-4